MEDSIRAGMYKFYYYYQMTKISIHKSSSDLDYKSLFPVNGLLSQNVWSYSDSDDEEEEPVNIYYHGISDSYMSESMSYSVWNYWGVR